MTTAFRAFPPVLILAALTVMVLPTWRTEWLGPTVDSVHVVEFRWFAPIILGYGNPFPLLCLGSTVLALVIALAQLTGGPGERGGPGSPGERGIRRGAGDGRGAGGGRGVALEVVLGVAIAAAACGAVIFDGLHGWALAAPALLLLCLLVLLLSRLVARVRRSRAGHSQPGSPPPGSPQPGSVREEISPGTDPGPIRGS
ncbi:hypothetical protein ACT3SQ_02345 [Brachybacterium sp. AOP42-C2-15]|uniref:hypothetical protein n=1 Tax=Brachybacterium sp. AOP42-C2-15 TaxID=3457670 RepID=UPI004034995F